MKQRKSIIALLLVAIIGIVGLTVAYFASSTTFENEFQTSEYGTTYTETFTSPTNWLPGDTTNKTVTVTNSGQVDEAVRISLSESWTPNNSNESLTGWIHADGTKSNHTTEEELSTDVRAAIINFTNNSDWTKVGNYYYYNYKLAPNQTTDSLIESVTFNALTKLGDTCTPSTNNGTTTIICNSSGEDYDHATYKLIVNIETVQYNKYQEAWNTNLSIAPIKPMNAQDLALKSNPISVTNYTDGNIHEMYTFQHDATDQTPALIDYRYIGDDPYNYAYFNCDNLANQNSETCEVWRIIGVFDVDRPDPNDNTQTITERRIKLVRGNDLPTKMQFYSNSSNDWSESLIKAYLNDGGEYYDNLGDALTNKYGLKESAKEMLEETVYYLGAGTYSSYDQTSYGSTERIYRKERGSLACCSCFSDITKIKWIGKVALMYPSDDYMIYAKGIDDDGMFTCYPNPSHCNPRDKAKKGWIYNSNIINDNGISNTWFLTPLNDSNEFFFSEGDEGRFTGRLSTEYSNYSYGVRPVVYLSSNVKITAGTGQENDPYKLGL